MCYCVIKGKMLKKNIIEMQSFLFKCRINNEELIGGNDCFALIEYSCLFLRYETHDV